MEINKIVEMAIDSHFSRIKVLESKISALLNIILIIGVTCMVCIISTFYVSLSTIAESNDVTWDNTHKILFRVRTIEGKGDFSAGSLCKRDDQDCIDQWYDNRSLEWY